MPIKYLRVCGSNFHAVFFLITCQHAVLLSPPQIPAGLTGFLRIPQDSSGLLYNFGDFELVEKNTDKSLGILRIGTEFLLN